jgi:serine/threonine-protein kinase
VAVPDVTNRDLFAATAEIESAGLVAQLTPTVSATVPKGAVIATNPAAGTQVPRGTTVQVLLSTGPELIDVPNVVGQTQATAIELLNVQLGLGITIQQQNAGATNRGLVIAQSPTGGQVPKGSTVVIVVGA